MAKSRQIKPRTLDSFVQRFSPQEVCRGEATRVDKFGHSIVSLRIATKPLQTPNVRLTGLKISGSVMRGALSMGKLGMVRVTVDLCSL